MTEKVLCVDDEQNVLAGFRRNLRNTYNLDTATDGEEALRLLVSRGPYAVMVVDMQMPGMNGVTLLTRAMQVAPDTVRFMLTGNGDQQTAIEAVNRGQVFRFLTKPCSPDALALALAAGVRQYNLAMAERELLEKTLSGSVRLLTEIVSLQDPATFGRCQVLREMMREFLREFPVPDAWMLELGAMLCHLGLITLPPSLLAKQRAGQPLNHREEETLERVPEIGASLLAHIPRLEPVARIVRYREKCFDGRGLPDDALAGSNLPIGSRVLKVLSDLLDLEARGGPRSRALQIMQKRVGHYDPEVLAAACVCFDSSRAGPDDNEAVPRSIQVRDLRVAHVLVSDLETSDGILILPAGTQITPTLLEKVRNFALVIGLRQPFLVQSR